MMRDDSINSQSTGSIDETTPLTQQAGSHSYADSQIESNTDAFIDRPHVIQDTDNGHITSVILSLGEYIKAAEDTLDEEETPINQSSSNASGLEKDIDETTTLLDSIEKKHQKGEISEEQAQKSLIKTLQETLASHTPSSIKKRMPHVKKVHKHVQDSTTIASATTVPYIVQPFLSLFPSAASSSITQRTLVYASALPTFIAGLTYLAKKLGYDKSNKIIRNFLHVYKSLLDGASTTVFAFKLLVAVYVYTASAAFGLDKDQINNEVIGDYYAGFGPLDNIPMSDIVAVFLGMTSIALGIVKMGVSLYKEKKKAQDDAAADGEEKAPENLAIRITDFFVGIGDYTSKIRSSLLFIVTLVDPKLKPDFKFEMLSFLAPTLPATALSALNAKFPETMESIVKNTQTYITGVAVFFFLMQLAKNTLHENPDDFVAHAFCYALIAFPTLLEASVFVFNFVKDKVTKTTSLDEGQEQVEATEDIEADREDSMEREMSEFYNIPSPATSTRYTEQEEYNIPSPATSTRYTKQEELNEALKETASTVEEPIQEEPKDKGVWGRLFAGSFEDNPTSEPTANPKGSITSPKGSIN